MAVDIHYVFSRRRQHSTNPILPTYAISDCLSLKKSFNLAHAMLNLAQGQGIRRLTRTANATGTGNGMVYTTVEDVHVHVYYVICVQPWPLAYLFVFSVHN